MTSGEVMPMTNILDRLFGNGAGEEQNDPTPEPDTTTLHRVKWEGTHTETYTDVTETLTWSGGATKKVRYTLEHSDPGWGDYAVLNKDTGDVVPVLYSEDQPAIREPEGERQWEREETRTHYAWVSEVPPNVEETGETKEVVQHD